ncbi:MAG: hypothetical protein C5S38_07140 [Candidatus Methanophagaceae archaeon]|nr:MAG: hypothetical protein C5S38_07140 [Methanophagales archaeon]
MPKKEGGKDKAMLKKIFVILGLACIVLASFGLASATITNEGFNYIAGHMAGYGINSYAPMWSPNSTQIAYIQDDTERADVWVMDAIKKFKHTISKKINPSQGWRFWARIACIRF